MTRLRCAACSAACNTVCVLLVYDGDCGFCTASARWLQRRLPPRVRVEPGQAIDLVALGLTAADVDAAAWWFEAEGSAAVRGHAAIAAALVAGGGCWKVLGLLISRPPLGWVARVVYSIVARNRSRLPGGSDSCGIDERADRNDAAL